MRRQLHIQLIGLILCWTPITYGQSRDAQVASIIEQVHLDSLMTHVAVLSGEAPIFVGDSLVTLSGRTTDVPVERAHARRYLSSVLARYGLDVREQPFYTTGTNLYAVQRGTTRPDDYVVIGAHYDSKSAGITAPGADDNASGTAAVLETARLLSQVATDYSVIYALWDEEEIGLIGSGYFAETAYLEGTAIRGVIVLDMLAFDRNDDGRFVINFDYNSAGVADVVDRMASRFSLDLTSVLLPFPSSGIGSDHRSFWRFGFPAVLLIEHVGVDFNPYWHTTLDRVEAFNTSFYLELAKLAAASASALSLGEHIPSAETLFGQTPSLAEAYPNPFTDGTEIAYTLPYDTPVELVIYDILGREIFREFHDRRQAGTYIHRLDGSNLAGGVYFCRLQVGPWREVHSFVRAR